MLLNIIKCEIVLYWHITIGFPIIRHLTISPGLIPEDRLLETVLGSQRALNSKSNFAICSLLAIKIHKNIVVNATQVLLSLICKKDLIAFQLSQDQIPFSHRLQKWLSPWAISWCPTKISFFKSSKATWYCVKRHQNDVTWFVPWSHGGDDP